MPAMPGDFRKRDGRSGPRARFPFAANAGSFRGRSTITAILESHADGTLNLPLPAELRHGKIKEEAKLEGAPQDPDGAGPR
jgi:hypothetical protein